MADRNDAIRELAMLTRQSHFAACGIVGYLAAGASTEVLLEALQYGQELRREWAPGDGHLALVNERYGPPAGRA